MTPFVTILLWLYLISGAISFSSFWGASRLLAGPNGTFLNVLKCNLIWIAIGIGASAFLALLFFSFGANKVFLCATLAAGILFLITAFAVPMKIFEISFPRTLVLLLLSALFSLICNWGVSIFATPIVAPTILRDGPAMAALIKTWVKKNGGRAASAPAPVPASYSSLLELARQDVENAKAKVTQLETNANQAYVDLAEKRKVLDTKSAPAVHRFNMEAANYSSVKTELVKQQKELARLIKQEELVETQAAEAAEKRSHGVVMYSTSWCPACKAARQYFEQKNIPYEDIDVEHSPEGAAEYKRLGSGGVPTIVIRGEKMSGFNSDWVERHLEN